MSIESLLQKHEDDGAPCKWRQDHFRVHQEEPDCWDTDCENTFEFFEGGPKDNRFKFCPYCGKTIEEVES